LRRQSARDPGYRIKRRQLCGADRPDHARQHQWRGGELQRIAHGRIDFRASDHWHTSLSSIDTKTPAKGAATTANSSPVNIASDQVVPVNDPGLPDTLGQKTMANSTGVVLASDQSALTVAQATAASLNATVVGTGTFAAQAAPTASTTGGATPYTAIVPNNTTGVLVGTAGQHTVYAITAFNNSATIAYVKFYDTATAPTCGSGTVVYHGLIPANTSGAGFVNPVPVGVAFGSGIGYCITTGIADNDTTAPAASTYLINIEYK
jgi:hypothetical protein